MYYLIFTGLILTNGGVSVDRQVTEFGSKIDCVNAIVAESGQNVNYDEQIPKLVIRLEYKGTQAIEAHKAPGNFISYTCVPKDTQS